MSGALPEPHFPRTIRPRKSRHTHRPIIALSHSGMMVESLGDKVYTADEFPSILRSHPSAIIVCQGFGKHLQQLQREYQDDSQFQYRCTPIRRYSRPWDDGRRLKQGMITDSICNFVGWQRREDQKHRPNVYHYPLDPIWFLTTSIDKLDDSDRPRLVKLYEWAQAVRQWCEDNQLEVKASAGGLAAQLLKDSRFYPEPRRKVPRFVNDIARVKLPGNYYRLHAKPGKRYRAFVIDMENAHHALASRIRFPDSNNLRAHGYWGVDRREREATKRYAPGDAHLHNPGVYHARVTVPHIPSEFFPPPFMEQYGERNVFLFSNELELVESLGGKIQHIYSSYTSDTFDTGLNKYAKFAIEQIRKYPSYKPWLKPTLHATYGVLASRPRAFETGYLRATGGQPNEYLMGPASIQVRTHKQKHEIESSIANVIHRGMIEAEVRKEALWFARFLHEADGHNILAIYADAIFIEDTGRPVRLLPPPWRIKETLTNLRWHSAVHFTSPSLTRLPGIPESARERFLAQRELAREVQGGDREPARRAARTVQNARKMAGFPQS